MRIKKLIINSGTIAETSKNTTITFTIGRLSMKHHFGNIANLSF